MLTWELGTMKGKLGAYAIASFRISPDQDGKRLGPTAATAKAGQEVEFGWTLLNKGPDANDVTVTIHPPKELTGAPN